MKSIVLAALSLLGVWSAQAIQLTLVMSSGGSSASLIGDTNSVNLSLTSPGQIFTSVDVTLGDYYLSAPPAPGYVFTGWVINPTNRASIVSTGDPLDPTAALMTITALSGQIKVTANYSPKSTLTLALGPGGLDAALQSVVGSIHFVLTPPATAASTNTMSVGDVYSISTDPAAGYEFAGWVVNPGSNLVTMVDPSALSTSMTVTNASGNVTVTATFRKPSVALVVSTDGRQANISPSIGTNYIAMGSTQVLSTTAITGFRFAEWEDPAVPGNPYTGVVANPSNAVTTIVMSDNYAVKAVFAQTCIVTQHNPQGPGSTDYVGAPLDVGSMPVISVSSPIPSITENNARYVCTGWTNAGPDLTSWGVLTTCTYGNSAGLTTNNQVTWTWKKQYLVTINLGGTGAGIISSPTITLTSTTNSYSGWLDSGVVLTLSETPQPMGAFTSHFGGWTLPAGMILAPGETLLSPNIHVTINGVTTPIQASFIQDNPIGNNGLPVAWSTAVGLDPDADRSDPISGYAADPDGDGLPNYVECSLSFSNATLGVMNCDPLNWDTDGDGMDDKWERDYFGNDTAYHAGTMVPPWLDGGTFAADARYGAQGNPSSVYLWDTTTGYEMKNQPLTNIKRYVGPDGIPPYTTQVVPPGGVYTNWMRTTTGIATVLINNLARTIYFARPNDGTAGYPKDTRDQSNPLMVSTMKDGFDDGFKYSWDQWQMNDTAVAGNSSLLANTILWPGITQRVEDVTGRWVTYRPFKPNSSSGALGNLGQGYLFNPLTGRIVTGATGGLTAFDAYQASTLYGAASGTTYPVKRNTIPGGTTGNWCTNPFLWDTDRDGLPDGWELSFGYDPWDKDTGSTGTTDDKKDPLHKTFAFDGTLRNNAVCVAHGYNPHTSLHDPADWTKLGPNTAYYTLYQEILCDNIDSMANRTSMTLASQLTLNGGLGWRTTNPNTIDSDGDGMYDGWEMYVALDPLSAADSGLDPDQDGLTNFQEFDSHWTPPGDSNAAYYVAGWFNKTDPTDPHNPDTDGDQLYDGQEKGLFNSGAQATYTVTVTTNSDVDLDGNVNSAETLTAANGGLCPTTVDTDGDYMPDNWEAFYGSTRMPNPPVNGTIADATLDADGDGLLNYQEYMTGFVYMWQFQHVDPRWNPQVYMGGMWSGGPADYTQPVVSYTSGLGFGGYEPYDFIATSNSVALYNSTALTPLVNTANQFGLQPHTWDRHYWAISPIVRPPGVPYTFLCGMMDRPVITLPQFATCDPGLKDTDGDGMDDYWEVCHGLNPLFGLIDIVRSSLDFIVNNPDGYGGAADATLDQYDMLIPQLPADLRTYPWISGYPLTDADQDGLDNIDESLQVDGTTPPTYHTDPSPLWMTDTSSPESWVNQYYWLGNVMGAVYEGGWWFWDFGVMRDFTQMDTPAPTFLFDFEMNEGFDTDHDNLADRAELVSDAALKPGVTDPLDDLSPPKRRALHFDGVNSAVRTQTGFVYTDNVLQQFTIESWVQLESGNDGLDKTVIERPGMVEQGNSDLEPSSLLVNFRLGLDGTNVPYVAYNGKARPFLYVMAKAPAYYSLKAGAWYHLAGTFGGDYDSTGQWVGHLKLYVNGQVAADVPSSEIPVNGYVGTSGTIPGQPATFEQTIPMPLVVGASDQNPGAMIFGGGAYGLVGYPATVLYLNGAPSYAKFFHGWIDQVRIWNGARTQDQIAGLMKTRHTRADIIGLSQTNNLLHAYTFDNLPDPNYEGIEPAGFNDVMGRPAGYTTCPWWGEGDAATVHSLWYNDYNNYREIPWITDAVAHNPVNQPVDSTFSIIQSAFSNGWMVVAAGTNLFPNSSNPYNMGYKTALRARFEMHPFLSTLIDSATGTDVSPDMLPCGRVYADENLAMWDDGSNPAVNDLGDLDGDGLPDWWEVKYGLDPTDPTGNIGAYGDLDGDGLDNLAEYLAGTDPHSSNSSGVGGSDGLSDYDHRATPNGLTFGELYTGMDSIPALWKYSYGLGPDSYVADDDPDADGWDNYAEYMAGTSPIAAGNYPQPNLKLTLWYGGQPLAGNIVLSSYTTPSMDGNPDATMTIAPQQNWAIVGNVSLAQAAVIGQTTLTLSSVNGITPNVTYLVGNGLPAGTYVTGLTGTVVSLSQPVSGTLNAGATLTAENPAAVSYPLTMVVSSASNVVGHIREGNNYFFCYYDRNSDGVWEPGEPCGYAVYQPLYVSWSELSLDISLQDTAQGFPRIEWVLPSGTTSSRVRLNYAGYYLAGSSNLNSSAGTLNVIDVTLNAPRNYLTEADLIRYAGTYANIAGLYVPSSVLIPKQAVYQWGVEFNPLNTAVNSAFYPDTATNDAAHTFVETWTTASSEQPTILYPNNEVVQSLPIRLEWQTSSDSFPAFQVDIVQGSTTGPSLFSAVVRAPYYRDSGNVCHYVFYPQYWGSNFLPILDGTYYWRVTPVNNASVSTSASAWSEMLVNASGALLPPYTNSAAGPFSVTGTLLYEGKAGNHAISEYVTKGTGAAKTLTGTLNNTPVIPGSLAVYVIRSNTPSVWVTFTDPNATPGQTSSKLAGVSAYPGWQGATCTVTYASGSISISFTNTPATNDIVLATYDYKGYSYVVQAYPVLDVPGFSGKPVVETNLWQKGAFTLYGLPAGSYTLYAFLDQNGNGLRDKTESWGFIRGAVPSSGPGYNGITTVTVGPSISASKSVTVMLRDVDTDNDKLPDAWEVMEFGSISAHSGNQILNGVTTIWQSYASGPLDDDPVLTDSNFDGVPDEIADALGFDAHNVSNFSQIDAYLTGYTNTLFTIPSITIDDEGRPTLKWSSPAVDGSWNYQIVYVVQYTESLFGGTWTNVGYPVDAVPGDAKRDRIWTDTTFVPGSGQKGRFYRMQVGIVPYP